MTHYEDSDMSGESPPPPRGSRRRRLFWIIAAIAGVGLLVGLLIPAQRTVREPARRVACANHLRMIALALQEYEKEHHALPPPYTVDAQGKPLHSWRTLILPYMEQKALYDTIDLSKPWNDPVNKAAYETTVYAYTCPSADTAPQQTTYLAVVSANGSFQPVATGKAKSAGLAGNRAEKEPLPLVIELDAAHAVHWMSPNDADEPTIRSLASDVQGPHYRGFQAVYRDGHVDVLTTEQLRALVVSDGAPKTAN